MITGKMMRGKTIRGRMIASLLCFAALELVSGLARAELVSEWRFDGNARDSKGNNHGTLHGSPEWVADRHGKPGMALRLDGKDDWVDCGSDASLSFTDGNTDRPFSISVWVRLEDRRGLYAQGKV